eukprot:comp20819_c0_seq1/m.27453 comp20819_c0_seq1/g.27453  ORF comp20819_c0_seq1/g.27453 comp20819_c0_seq1/m.27453 type:complete len:761 (-) comp20819_c0_seq1:211-2493(-)
MFFPSLFLSALALSNTAFSAPTEKQKNNDSDVVTVEIGLRTLVLYKTPDDNQIARLVLDGYGTQFDLFNTVPDLSTPRWHSIVVTDTSINNGDFTPIRDYARKYNIRIAYLNMDSDPDPIIGVQPAGNWSGAQSVVFDARGGTEQYADIMNISGYWDVSHKMQGAQGYTIVNKTSVIPFMRYTNGTVRTKTGPVAAFVTTLPSGVEEMHFGFDATVNELVDGAEGTPYRDQPEYVITGNFTKLNMALGNVWFQWITRGVYLGQRRLFLHMQVDDWFAQSDIYGVPNITFRINNTDVERTVEYVRTAVQKHGLAAGSYVRFEAAINGAFHSAINLEQNPGVGIGLNNATDKYLGDFNWLSHTWTHQQLDWLNPSDCNGTANKCQPTANRVNAELLANQMLAVGQEVDAASLDPAYQWHIKTPAGHMFYNQPKLADEHYSPECVITPEISGLYPASYNMSRWNGNGGYPRPRDTVAIQGMWNRGIRAVVGDNSRYELISPVSPHHGVITTVAEYGQGGIIIIPRHAVNIAYNAMDEETYLNFYNGNKVCGWSFGPACENRNYTLEEALERQAQTTTYFWLQYRADPFMFHQANLHHFNHGNRTVSLLTYWVDHTLDELTRYVTGLPVTSPPMKRQAEFYRQRMARDFCNITASMTFVNGTPASVLINSASNCTALLTVRRDNVFAQVNLTAANTVPVANQTVGPDNTYMIGLKGNGKVASINLIGMSNQEERESDDSAATLLGGSSQWAAVATTVVMLVIML